MNREYGFPELQKTVIVAMKGLPCTGKSDIAHLIGLWATCPVLYFDHFLDTLSLEQGYTSSAEAPDEAERLHRLAFGALCKAASNYLRWGPDIRYNGYKCVVVKSRLSSTFELDRLVQLARERGCGMILIIEFHTKNEYRVHRRLEEKVAAGEQKEWYKPRSLKDIEKAMDDDQPADWKDHLLRLLDNGQNETGGLPQVTRLVLDPFDDLILDPPARLTIGSLKSIYYLLGRLGVLEEDANIGDLLLEGRYLAVRHRELLRYLAEKKISVASGERSKYLCGTVDSQLCLFKYWEELQVDADCGVCEERVVSGQPAHACLFCTLTLHKSCAELQGCANLKGFKDVEFLRNYPNHGGENLLQRHACKRCIVGRKDFSPECVSCLFQTQLKWRMLPTILNHDCHDHFLTILFSTGCKCIACGTIGHAFAGSYGCYICSLSFDIGCLSLVRKVEHEHGGYKHLLKLCYSRDGMEEEESCWCDICYEDMDPQFWFYCCQECPYFAAHPQCVRLSSRFTN